MTMIYSPSMLFVTVPALILLTNAYCYTAASCLELNVTPPIAPNRQCQQASYGSEMTEIRVNLNRTGQFQFKANHGDAPIGVIGLQVDNETGIVKQVFPPSDLNRFEIQPGDRVLGYMGHQFFTGWQMEHEAVGVPGTFCEITILHNGQIISIPVKRTDARLLVQYEPPGYSHYSKCAARTRYW